MNIPVSGTSGATMCRTLQAEKTYEYWCIASTYRTRDYQHPRFQTISDGILWLRQYVGSTAISHTLRYAANDLMHEIVHEDSKGLLSATALKQSKILYPEFNPQPKVNTDELSDATEAAQSDLGTDYCGEDSGYGSSEAL